MNPTRAVCLAVVLVLLAACKGTPPAPGSAAGRVAGAEASDEFLNAYRTAHERDDVEAAMQLVYFEGVSEQLKTGFRRAFRTDFERQLASAELVDLTEPPLEEKTIDGRTYRANLKIVKELRVEFVRLKSPDGEISARSHPVGLTNGRYYIASTVVSASR